MLGYMGVPFKFVFGQKKINKKKRARGGRYAAAMHITYYETKKRERKITQHNDNSRWKRRRLIGLYGSWFVCWGAYECLFLDVG